MYRAATLLLLAICCVACNNPLGVTFEPEDACEGQTTDVTVTAKDLSRGQTVYVRALPEPGVEVTADSGTPSADFRQTDKLAGGKYYEVPTEGLVVHVTAGPGTAGRTVVFQSVWAFDGVPAEHTIKEDRLQIVECEDPEPGEEPEEPFVVATFLDPTTLTCTESTRLTVQTQVTGAGADAIVLWTHFDAPTGIEIVPAAPTPAEEWDPEGMPAGTYYNLGQADTSPTGEFEVRYPDGAECTGGTVTVTLARRPDGAPVSEAERQATLEAVIEAGQPEGGAEVHVTTVPGSFDPADACASEGNPFDLGFDRRITVAGGDSTAVMWSVTDKEWVVWSGFVSGLLGEPLSVSIVLDPAGDALVASNAGNWFMVLYDEPSQTWQQARIFSGGARDIGHGPSGEVLVTDFFGVNVALVDSGGSQLQGNTGPVVGSERVFHRGAAPDQFGNQFGAACRYGSGGNNWLSIWIAGDSCNFVAHDTSDPDLYAARDTVSATCTPTRTTCLGNFAATTDTAANTAILVDLTDPDNLVLTTRDVPDAPRDCAAVRDAAGDYFWYFSTEGGVYCLRHDPAGNVVNEGYLELPEGTASEFCTAHVYSDGTFVLYYDLLGTDQCGFVVADAPVDSTDTITVR